MIVKNTINSRITQNLNISTSFEMVVDNSEEAEKAGEDAFYIYEAWIKGFTEATPE